MTLVFRLGAAFLILILAMIAVPNFIPGQDEKAKPTVKAGMYTVQMLVETYAVDWEGFYPENLEQLYRDANLPGKMYWKELTNPITEETGPGQAYANETPGIGKPGLVTYEPGQRAQGGYTAYRIFGYDKDGQRVQQDGQDFVLIND